MCSADSALRAADGHINSLLLSCCSQRIQILAAAAEVDESDHRGFVVALPLLRRRHQQGYNSSPRIGARQDGRKQATCFALRSGFRTCKIEWSPPLLGPSPMMATSLPPKRQNEHTTDRVRVPALALVASRDSRDDTYAAWRRTEQRRSTLVWGSGRAAEHAEAVRRCRFKLGHTNRHILHNGTPAYPTRPKFALNGG